MIYRVLRPIVGNVVKIYMDGILASLFSNSVYSKIDGFLGNFSSVFFFRNFNLNHIHYRCGVLNFTHIFPIVFFFHMKQSKSMYDSYC